MVENFVDASCNAILQVDAAVAFCNLTLREVSVTQYVNCIRHIDVVIPCYVANISRCSRKKMILN
jgi:hypothetical protein